MQLCTAGNAALHLLAPGPLLRWETSILDRLSFQECFWYGDGGRKIIAYTAFLKVKLSFMIGLLWLKMRRY